LRRGLRCRGAAAACEGAASRAAAAACAWGL
jgi:hypothetical protein